MRHFYSLFLAIFFASCTTVHRGFISVSDDGQLYYEERGKGEPVLLLHGHSLDQRMWDEQWRPLSKQYRTIRIDFRGYGRSSEQREDLQMTHVDDVITLMDSFHIQRAHIIGLSMGAFVAGDMLAMYPDRLITCTMASGGIRNSKGPSEPMDTAESKKRDQEIKALQVKGVAKMKQEWIEQLMASGGSQRERMRKPLTQMIDQWTAWQPLHKEVRLFYGKEAWQRFIQQKNTTPTLLIRGAKELSGKKGEPRELQYLKNGRYIVIPDCGHMLNMERPKEFNQAVLEFLNSFPMH